MSDHLQSALAMPAHLSVRDQAHMPVPNRTCVVLTDRLAPTDLTTTGFVVAFTSDGKVVLANELERRRYEIPGGHIDPGEDALAAAAREAYEETGARVHDLKPIGYLRQIVSAERPDQYRYPYPTSFQQFFVGKVIEMDAYMPNEECGMPAVVSLAEAMDILDERHGAFVSEAVRIHNLTKISAAPAQ